MNWGNFILRLVFVAIVCLVLFWVIPAIVALIVAIIPPAGQISGAIIILLRAAVMLWGVYTLFWGGWPKLP